MFGMKFQLDFTSSGHYMIMIHLTLSRIPHNNPLLLNFADIDTYEKCKVADKLHKQFGHADSSRIVDLIKDAGMEDSDLSEYIKDVQDK